MTRLPVALPLPTPPIPDRSTSPSAGHVARGRRQNPAAEPGACPSPRGTTRARLPARRRTVRRGCPGRPTGRGLNGPTRAGPLRPRPGGRGRSSRGGGGEGSGGGGGDRGGGGGGKGGG